MQYILNNILCTYFFRCMNFWKSSLCLKNYNDKYLVDDESTFFLRDNLLNKIV